MTEIIKDILAVVGLLVIGFEAFIVVKHKAH